MVIATPPAFSTTCTGSTVTAPAGGSKVTFSGVNLNANQSCWIYVNVQVPLGTPVGNLNNSIPGSSATTDQGITNGFRPVGGGSFNNGAGAATLTVTNSNVTINKTFTPANVPVAP